MANQWFATIFWLIMFMAIFYVFLIMPQQRQQKKRKEMLSKLKVHDRIVTYGGLHGHITRVKENTVMARIADKVEVEIDKNAISYVAGKKED